MCWWIPISSTHRYCPILSASERASSMGMPNLLSPCPVETWAWVSGSTSGLTRRETRAVLPWRAARRSRCPSSQSGQHAQDGEVPVGLHRVADHVVEARESLVELPVSLLQSAVAVDVGRCARAPRDLGEGDLLAPETALPVVEVVQSLPPLGSAFPAACCILGFLKRSFDETTFVRRNYTPCRTPAHAKNHEDPERTADTKSTSPPPESRARPPARLPSGPPGRTPPGI